MDIHLKSLRLEDYPIKTYDKIRYADTDRQSHVNNAVFAQFFETGRVEILYHHQHALLSQDASFVIVKLNIDLMAEINWPGQVDIGTGVIRVGNSSVTMVQGLYQNNKLVATAETVIVQVDNKEKTSKPLSEKAKAFLETIKIV